MVWAIKVQREINLLRRACAIPHSKMHPQTPKLMAAWRQIWVLLSLKISSRLKWLILKAHCKPQLPFGDSVDSAISNIEGFRYANTKVVGRSDCSSKLLSVWTPAHSSLNR